MFYSEKEEHSRVSLPNPNIYKNLFRIADVTRNGNDASHENSAK